MYHKYECYINSVFKDVAEIVREMRSFFYALYLFEDNIDDLKTFMLSRSDVKKSVFDYNLTGSNSRDNARNLLHCIDSLDVPKYQIDRSVYKLIFLCHPMLYEMWETNELFIMSFISHHVAITRFYAQRIFKWPGNASKIMEQNCSSRDIRNRVGGAVYCFSSLIKHSCVPNIARHINSKNGMNLVVVRPINKGQQIFVSYR